MLIRIKTITPYSYSIKANAIKRKLARFKDDDFLRQFYKHFHELRDKKVGIIANFPWCCYLALKWKFTTPQNKDAIEMRYEDFVNIINRVYDLQSEASNLNAENNVILGIRRMMINQFLYQQTDKFNFASLIRQYIWYCEEGAFYEEKFESKTGLSLKNFYRMASYFIIVSSINDATDSEVFPYKIFIMHWSPIVGIEQVKKFLMLISLKPDELRSYLEPYKFAKPLTIEYYEDTPMLRKPVLMAQEGVVVLSKKILKAALVNFVPELFKSSFKEEYKVAFGKTLENYTANVFSNYDYSFINEALIKKIYQENKLEGKSVDFILRENDGHVLIDCKAIEPAPFVKVTSDPKKIRERLESSFIKGIFQGEHTAYNLTQAKTFTDTDKLSMFIVVHRDHYLSHGLDVESLIYPSLTSELEKKYVRLPIPLSRIYYITIDGLETLLNVCSQKGMTLNEFIDRCSAVDSGGQRKANIDMHIFEIMPEGVKDMDKLKEVGDFLFKDVFEVIGESGKIWDGEVEQYISMLSYVLNQ